LKAIFKILGYGVAIVGLTTLSLLAAGYFFKDKIINAFYAKANTYLTTPVQVGSTELSLIRNFPLLSITLNQVRIEDSHPEPFTLLAADRIAFSFDALEAWNGNFEILKLEIENSVTNIRYDKKGESNFRVLRDTSANKESSIRFRIKNFSAKQTEVVYEDFQSNHKHHYTSEKIRSEIDYSSDVYAIKASGDLGVILINLDGLQLLQNKKFTANTYIELNPTDESFDVRSAVLETGNARFSVEGFYDFGASSRVDLSIISEGSDVKAITPLLPNSVVQALAPYQSTGNVSFKLRISGIPGTRKGLLVTSDFSCRNASFTHPETGFTLDSLFAEGIFSGTTGDQSQNELALKNISGRLNRRSFNANLSVRDLNNPFIDTEFNGAIDHIALERLLPDSLFSNVEGSLNADFKLSGFWEDLKSRSTARRAKANGSILFNNVSFNYRNKNQKFIRWSGSMALKDSDINLENLKGSLGRSDLLLNGKIINALPFILQDNQDLGLDIKLGGAFLDMDEILNFAFGEDSEGEYDFKISPRLRLKMFYLYDRFHYKKFSLRSITGQMRVEDQVADFSGNHFSAMGGTLDFDGTIDAAVPGRVGVQTDIHLSHINIDSIFYVFEDFKQEFITQKHLKGLIDADLLINATLDRKLDLIPKDLNADISFLIRRGELNNFEPIYALNKYLDDEGLRKLRFGDLKNDILIRDRTILIPKMEIKSNLTVIELSGSHTFDQHIDYRIVAPFSRRKNNKAEAEEAIQTDAQGRSKIFLKITGTTDDYKVEYDFSAVKQKISTTIKNEFKSLRESLRSGKKQEKKKVVVSEDDFFDWDN